MVLVVSVSDGVVACGGGIIRLGRDQLLARDGFLLRKTQETLLSNTNTIMIQGVKPLEPRKSTATYQPKG